MKRTINYCGTPTNVASKFILISVCDGNIDTFHFYNFNDAVDEMLGQLWVVYMGAGQDRNKWESIKREEQYSANGFGFEINRDSFEYTSILMVDHISLGQSKKSHSILTSKTQGQRGALIPAHKTGISRGRQYNANRYC